MTRPHDPGDKDATLTYVGAGGPIIGRRADGIILDDLVDEPVARSEIELAARVLWVRRSVLSRLKPAGWVLAAGTRWVEDDVVTTLEESGEWVVCRMVAESDGREVYADVTLPDGVSWRPQRFEYAEAS